MKKSSEIRLFKYVRINIQLIFRDKSNYKRIRGDHIHFLFEHSIFPLFYVSDKYDANYEDFKNHQQTFEITWKMLIKEEKNINKQGLITLENNLSLPRKTMQND